MVNLDIEPNTNDLRSNEHEKMRSVIDREEDGEDERCEAFGRFDWRREIDLSPTSEEQDEGGEEGGEDERCEVFGSFDWKSEIDLSPTSEEQEEDEGGEYEEDEGGEYEEDEGGEQDGEDERCETSGSFDWRKKFVMSPTSEEHKESEFSEEDEAGEYKEHEVGECGEDERGEYEEDEGGEKVSEDERCEASGSFDWMREFVTSPTSEEHKEYEFSEEDEGGEYEEHEGGEEDEGGEYEEHEGVEEDGEDERCEAFGSFDWMREFDMCPLEEDEGSEEYACEEGEGSEESEEDGEDERCETSESFYWRKAYVLNPTCEEHREEEGSEEDEEGDGSEEDGENERCEVSGSFDWRKKFVSEEHKEYMFSEEDYGSEGDEGSEKGSEFSDEDSDEGSEESSEDDEESEEDKRFEASRILTGEEMFKLFFPIREEHKENEHGKADEGGVEDDISDSEINEYKEAAYKFLKFRTYKIKGPNGELGCPFCVGNKKQEYYRLLSHALRVAGGFTESAKQRANHSAMAKYLVVDLADYAERLPPRANRILCNFTRELDLRKESMDQLKSKYEEKTMSVRKMLREKDETQRTFFEEARNMLRIARDQSKSVLEQQEMMNFDYENKRRRLNCWSEELNKREATLSEEKRKMDDLVREKNDLDILYHHHLAKERLPNDELLEVGDELMKGLEDMPSHCRVKIGVKRRHGEIDEKSFMSECKKRYRLNEAEIEDFELCCSWIKKMRDDNGNPQRLLNENKDEDEKLLRGLKDKWGNKIYNAAVEVEHNSNVMELWNFEEDRPASHSEVIRHIFSRWKPLQCMRDEIDEMIKTLF